MGAACLAQASAPSEAAILAAEKALLSHPPAPAPASGLGTLPALRLLNLFAGKRRKADVREHMEGLCAERGIALCVQERDLLLRGELDNLLVDEVWLPVLERPPSEVQEVVPGGTHCVDPIK